MKFKCENCGNVTPVGLGACNMTCPKCGCTDLRFNENIQAFPRIGGLSDYGPGTIFRANESFSGVHPNGTIWRVEPIELPEEKTDDPEPEEEDHKPSTPNGKKVALAKAIRKVKE